MCIIDNDKCHTDVCIKMSGETFDRLSNKEISGFKAFATGKLGVHGNLGVLKKFDKEIVEKYLKK